MKVILKIFVYKQFCLRKSWIWSWNIRLWQFPNIYAYTFTSSEVLIYEFFVILSEI